MSNSIDNFWGISGSKELKVDDHWGILQKDVSGYVWMEDIKPHWWGASIYIKIPELYKSPTILDDSIILAKFVIFDKGGYKVYPLIVRTKKNQILIYFDIEKTIDYLIHERYYKIRRPFYTHLPVHIHSIPGPMRSLLKKIFFGKGKENFPAWPIEPSVEALRCIYLNCLRLAGNKEKIKPFWPKKKKYAVMFSHDIDTKKGFFNIDKFMNLEKKYGVKSCINILGSGYGVNIADYDKFVYSNFEFGMHGYIHDNKLIFLPKSKISDHLSQKPIWIRMKGFRSPSLLRSPKLFKVLESMFEWDSSCIDTERGSQVAYANGCCTVFPFYKGGLLEIPITIPQDALGGNLDVWLKKLKFIKDVGGIAVFNVHPEPHLSGNEAGLEQYENLLRIITKDESAWITLPSNLKKWCDKQWKKK